MTNYYVTDKQIQAMIDDRSELSGLTVEIVRHEVKEADKAGIMGEAFRPWMECTPAIKGYLGWRREGLTTRLTRLQRSKLFPILWEVYTGGRWGVNLPENSHKLDFYNEPKTPRNQNSDYEKAILNRQEADERYW